MLIKLTEYFSDSQFYLETSLVQRLEDVSNQERRLTLVQSSRGDFTVLGDFDFLARLINNDYDRDEPPIQR